ncbi:undecaprenyl-phosphate glucose phosphotransferase [candidate division KSB1 bacterium]|nr:undecaprenyl-phosphate glucose phosphotransferase [candidate division KSB1 bacterium]NIR71245.1 undecaprenyl-phosphate glucose phosphotransferase [candidate division KSB1 bacterium]NIS26186.1 undecaprenyl-phosphate glucose phosphotransferase [candidate division KSB1 bacterium]NIT72964.1 undecaprenyl-phosphate glucose phosphotransferase [candidate division KSB1 bacterium]NIU26833.1 undecaprenyl-phosphate glucose phosphotransferase [candidate division KSB1 bacterium]
MPKFLEKLLLILIDFIAIALSFLVWAWLRRELGFFSETNLSFLLLISCIIFAFWFLIFSFFGMYSHRYAQSRLDEIITVLKCVTFGVLIIFLVTFDLERDLSSPPKVSRMFIINYWLIVLAFVSLTRVGFRSVQRTLLSSGIGQRRTLIVGWNERSRDLADKISQFPALGYKVVGFVGEDSPEVNKTQRYQTLPVLGGIDELEQIVTDVKAQEVILALKGHSRKRVMEVLNLSNGVPINFKIVPDLYDIVMGQARTNQIYGFPLIDIMPDLMPEWERKVKRLMDIVISSAILLLFSPASLLIALAIKLDSKGPVLYKQKRVGKDGKEFTIYKFRSMIHNAESLTGPRWAERKDPRITRVGRIIRRPRIDEVPQFLNVLKGEMSLIGPRPERPYFVETFKKQIPFYARRLKVKPGITGWAQIKGDYDTSIENVKSKLQYDLFYLENMSLRMDLKILINTIYVMLLGRGY